MSANQYLPVLGDLAVQNTSFMMFQTKWREMKRASKRGL
jgi:hypothetical protein